MTDYKMLNPSSIIAQTNINEAKATPYLLGKWFPDLKINGITFEEIQTPTGRPPTALKITDFDVNAPYSSTKLALSVTTTQLPVYREAIKLNEKEFIDLQSNENPKIVEQKLLMYINQRADKVSGAILVPHPQITQLLTERKITVIDEGNTGFTYNFDEDGTLAQERYAVLTGADTWDKSTSTPWEDISAVLDIMDGISKYMIISRKTWSLLLKSAQKIFTSNMQTAVPVGTEQLKAFFMSNYGLTVYVYTKKYTKVIGGIETQANLWADEFVTFLPEEQIGNIVYGDTAEGITADEDTALTGRETQITNTGVAVTVLAISHPSTLDTIISETVFPSAKNLKLVYTLKVLGV